MFSFLSQKFDQIYDSLRGIKTIDENSMKSFFETIKYSLIEADVNYVIIDEIIELMRVKCFGVKVSKKLLPEEFVSKQLLEVMIEILGGRSYSKIDLLSKINNLIKQNIVDKPIIIALVGLQGSGKTTSISKLIYRLINKVNNNFNKKLIATVSLDYDRPAAREQLAILSEKLEIENIKCENASNALDAAKIAIEYANNKNIKILFVDLAGRVTTNESMMSELKQVSGILNTENIFLVIDSMMGQEGLSIAKEFSKIIKFYGAIITKTDSDAPGGIILGITKLLNIPIKYISRGEKPEEFDIFNPVRSSEKILGFGDIIGFAEAANIKIAEEEESLIRNSFKTGSLSATEYISIINALSKIGSMKSIVSMIPKDQTMSKINNNHIEEMETINKTFKYLYNSMNKKERTHTDIILNNNSRIDRIKKGAGISTEDCKKVLDYYSHIRIKMKDFSKIMKYF